MIIHSIRKELFYSHRFLSLLFIFLLLFLQSCRKHDFLENRWVYVSRTLQSDRHVSEIKEIVEQASNNGLNGMVFSGRLDNLYIQNSAYFDRLAKVKSICDSYNIEIIPIIFSAGYGSAVIYDNKNLAVGLPVESLPYLVQNGHARLIRDRTLSIINGDFEQAENNSLANTHLQDLPGQISFVDRKIKKQGRQSIRFQNFDKHPNGNARLMYEVKLKPYRNYKITTWVKTENLNPAENLRFQIYSGDGRTLKIYSAKINPTSNWTKIQFDFNSMNYDAVNLYAGVWGGISGKFWVDDLRISEIGLANVLRRPGTPIVVKSAANGESYQESKDFNTINDPKFNFYSSHDGPTIRISPNSRIQNNDTLLVSYYQGLAINNSQVSLCLSEPKLYELWRERVQQLHEVLSPKKYLLSMDEIRQGGTCAACKSRGISMAEILGDCISKQSEILKELNPQNEIFIWSDMLDPNHNAKDNYYLVDGDFTGSWNYIPKDISIVCWYYEMRDKSLAHFSNLGFKTIGAAYYDGEDLDNPKGWLESLANTENSIGIMYTTWQNKYQLLTPFSKLVLERRNRNRK